MLAYRLRAAKRTISTSIPKATEMNSTHPFTNLTLTDLIRAKLAQGLDLQLMPTQSEQRVAIVSTELARWYIVDPDSREEHEQLLRRQRLIFDAFAESCLKGFRRYFSKVMSTKAIATVGELVVGPSGTEFAGDITMIEYGDGARRYIPYRHAFGITRRQYDWKMVSRRIGGQAGFGERALATLIEDAAALVSDPGEKWRISCFDTQGGCWSGTFMAGAFENDFDCSMTALPDRNDLVEIVDPFQPFR